MRCEACAKGSSAPKFDTAAGLLNAEEENLANGQQLDMTGSRPAQASRVAAIPQDRVPSFSATVWKPRFESRHTLVLTSQKYSFSTTSRSCCYPWVLQA